MSQEHENFIKTPKQLIIIVTLAFVVPIALFMMLSQLMAGQKAHCASMSRQRGGGTDQARSANSPSPDRKSC
jgi:hypothetical protein